MIIIILNNFILLCNIIKYFIPYYPICEIIEHFVLGVPRDIYKTIQSTSITFLSIIKLVQTSISTLALKQDVFINKMSIFAVIIGIKIIRNC